MSNKQQSLEMSDIMKTDLICFSHLRWDFVYQRPQHLMSRFAKQFRTFFIQEAEFHELPDTYHIKHTQEDVFVVSLLLNRVESNVSSMISRQKKLLGLLFKDLRIDKYICWYYTPMALKISSDLKPEMIIYDCMDELSAFKFAPAELKIMEAELFSKAHLVFTGGHSLFEAKKNAHHNIYPFPSSIDKAHFLRGRKVMAEPADQQGIPHRRFGFYGVIDERFNIKLIKEVAEKRPDWQLVLIGPVVKIDPDDLPKQENIHYLGSKPYSDLPQYLSGWDVAMICFEINESTRYISPTKTPEYLAAGKPVISTPITDVVTPYGEKGLVHIVNNAAEFIASAENEFNRSGAQVQQWLNKVDDFLKNVSWDFTVAKMMEKIRESLVRRNSVEVASKFKSVA